MKIPTQKIQICVGIFLQHYTFLQKRTFSILYENFSRFVRKATTVGFKSLRFLCVTKKQKTPQLWCLLFFWPTRRDLNPHSPESESVALSNCATDGYKPHFSYGCFLLSNTINQRVLPKLRTALPARFGDPQAFW